MRGGKWWECGLEGCGGQGHGGPHGCVELGRQAEGCLVRCALLKPNSWMCRSSDGLLEHYRDVPVRREALS